MKKKKFIKASKIFAVITASLAICITFSMADLFSSLITVGGFTFTNNDISIPKYSVYAICTNTTQNKAQADEISNISKMQGGAGYIYLYDGKFYIVASIYENESDADKVLANIKSTHTNASKLAININSTAVSCNLSSEEKQTLEDSLNIFKNIYKKLYDISVSLDTALINEVNARLAVNTTASEIAIICNNFTTLFNTQMNNSFLKIKLKLNELSDCLNNLINSPTTYPYTSALKLAYTQTLFIYKSLAESLN